MNTFSKTEAFTHGFRLTLNNFWLWVKIAVTQLVIIAVTGTVWFLTTIVILKAMAWNDPMAITFTFADTVYSLSLMQLGTLLLLSLLYCIVMFGFWVGYNKIMLEVDETGKGHIKTLFSGFGIVWPRMLIAVLLYAFIVIVGLFAFIIPGIILMVRFYFINWLILEKNLGIIAAFKESFRMTRGHTWPLFIFVLCNILLSAATKGWALLFVMPITFLASIYVYRKLQR